jgi:hypothetical protein
MRKVEAGESTGVATEVTGGLQAGETVLLHPSDRVKDGTRVRSK